MSKRFFPQQMGDRKRAKLDISISDHNFPLSQNKEPDRNDWGDDNDDEILLLASQACEEACNGNDISLLPNYSMCMQPGSTSTQLFSTPGSSTSNTEFTFKKPSANPPSAISTSLKDKCNRISSPLPGITANVMPKANEPGNISDDLIFNDKIYKGQDSNHVYRQLMQLQEENAKLKSENGKLLEKCVTKEGEASILRTQLKTSQISVDNARMEKIKAQEKVQMEWTEKLTAVNNQMRDLRTQLDFKNLEIISIKEKCKKLESSKVKLTQVTVANNDISSRQSSSFAHNELTTQRRLKTSSNAVQTDDKAHFITLNNTYRTESTPLPSLLPLILEPTPTPHSLLDYNEKLTQTQPYKRRIYSTLHRVPVVSMKREGTGVQLVGIYEDVVKIASGKAGKDNYCNVFNAVHSILSDVQSRLEAISRRMSTAFQKEMDERYIESTSSFIDVSQEDLLRGKPLYKEEQEILARRMTAVLCYVAPTCAAHAAEDLRRKVIECIEKICSLLDSTSTATLHSGLLLSILLTIKPLQVPPPQTLSIIRTVISSRPMGLVACRVLEVGANIGQMCPNSSVGNLKMDYDQGVLLYKKENCHVQVLLKQVEAALKCIELQKLTERAADVASRLIVLHWRLNRGNSVASNKNKCDCQLVLIQVIVYALRICADMLHTQAESRVSQHSLLSVCRCGLHLLYQASMKDMELGARLAHYEGHLLHYCQTMRGYTHSEIYGNMLSELTGTLQSSPEDMPPSFHKQPWLKSFQSFSVTD